MCVWIDLVEPSIPRTQPHTLEHTSLRRKIQIQVERPYLPFVAKGSSLDLLRDALIDEWSQLFLIFDFKNLLGASGWIRNIQLICCKNEKN